jgi:hypothetical protein
MLFHFVLAHRSGTTLNNIMTTNKATLSKGRSGWCVIFRHPLLDGSGGQKKRVRRGLGTRDENQAQGLVNQLNELLQSPEFWSPANRQRLEAKFDEKIVRAFFDGVDPEDFDPYQDRSGFIPVPTKEDDYVAVQCVGTTGSGKTTLIRQLLGTDPKSERFPSTSAAKTTTCDIEVVIASGHFRAAISFLTRDHATQLVADCVAACAYTFLEKGSPEEAERRLFEHADQRFRLNYILGQLRQPRANDGDDDDTSDEADGNDETLSNEERQRMTAFLERCLADIRSLAERLTQTLAAELGESLEEMATADKDAFEELAEAELLKDEGFHSIVDRIVEEIEERFEPAGTGGEFRFGRDGWPQHWTFTTPDRGTFLRIVNRFSSNYAPHFGRLLTPLVQGIRVAGPFAPVWHDGSLPKLVLIDGQGLGHTSDSTSSVSTSVTKRFDHSDLILLVDNAAQPMQAASQAVLMAVVSSGHVGKLVVCFTHFDEVRGPNLPDVDARKNHVKGSFDNAVSGVGKALGRDAEAALRRLFADRLVFFSKIQEPLTPKNTLTSKAFEQLLTLAAKAIEPPEPDAFRPTYDVANLIIAIQRAAQQFHTKWSAKLGFVQVAGESPEPWQKLKALTRRIAHFKQDEYDALRPVADMVKFMQDEVSKYLANPLSWTPAEPAGGHEEERARILDAIRQKVFAALHALSTQRLIQSHLADWVTAYDHRGAGSTRSRARDIRAVYEAGAPVPAEMPGKDANDFLFDVRSLVQAAITSSGGAVVGWQPSIEKA